MTYDVGQILYVVSGETMRIVPLLVCEEIRRRTSSGEEVSYLVRGGAEMTTFDLKSVASTVHKSIDDALAELRRNFEQFLQQQATWTVEMQRLWYRPSALQQAPAPPAVQFPPPPSNVIPMPVQASAAVDVPSYEELAGELEARAKPAK